MVGRAERPCCPSSGYRGRKRLCLFASQTLASSSSRRRCAADSASSFCASISRCSGTLVMWHAAAGLPPDAGPHRGCTVRVPQEVADSRWRARPGRAPAMAGGRPPPSAPRAVRPGPTPRCVAVQLPGRDAPFPDSNNHAGRSLVVPGAAWIAFIDGVRRD